MLERWIQLGITIAGVILGIIAERRVQIAPPNPAPPPMVAPPVVTPPAPPPVVIMPPGQPPVVIPQPQPPAPPVTRTKPIEAIGRIQFGRAGCTATVIGPRRTDGEYDVLTAYHCIDGQPREGTMRLRNGKTFKVRWVKGDADADYCWLITVGAGELPTARLATSSPPIGVRVYHCGFGIDQPGNVEWGEVRAGPNSEGQCEYFLSVSSGDSGGGIVREDTQEVCSPVCCTSRLSGKGRVFGACPEAARAGRM